MSKLVVTALVVLVAFLGLSFFKSRMPLTGLPKTTEVKVFFIAIEDNGKSGKLIGCQDSVVAVERTIAPTLTPLKAALDELLSLKERSYGKSGLYNALYLSDLKLENLLVEKGQATIKLVGEIRPGGECDDPRFEAQIKETALQFPEVKKVEIFINGRRFTTSLK